LNLERKGLARPLEGLFGAMNDGSREFLADLTGCPLVHGQRNLLVLEFGIMQQGESPGDRHFYASVLPGCGPLLTWGHNPHRSRGSCKRLGSHSGMRSA